MNKNTKKFVNERIKKEFEEIQREDYSLDEDKDTDNDSWIFDINY